MATVTRPVTMAASAKVMRLWQIWRQNPLAITPADISRVGWDIEAVRVLEKWVERLRDDRMAIEGFAKTKGWTEDEKNAIRILWRSRIVLLEACKDRIDSIARYMQEARSLEARVTAYLAKHELADGDSQEDLPF
jgi:hypothetical protein